MFIFGTVHLIIFLKLLPKFKLLSLLSSVLLLPKANRQTHKQKVASFFIKDINGQ